MVGFRFPFQLNRLNDCKSGARQMRLPPLRIYPAPATPTAFTFKPSMAWLQRTVSWEKYFKIYSPVNTPSLAPKCSKSQNQSNHFGMVAKLTKKHKVSDLQRAETFFSQSSPRKASECQALGKSFSWKSRIEALREKWKWTNLYKEGSIWTSKKFCRCEIFFIYI